MVCVQEQCVKDTAAILHRRGGDSAPAAKSGKETLGRALPEGGHVFEQKDNDAV